MAATLLVLTDFLRPANQAVNYAAALAAPLGANLVLLHVHRDALLDPERLTGKQDPLDTEAVNLAFDSLVRDISVPAIPEIAHGRVADAVAAALRRHQPLLLVLGRPDNTDDLPDELMATTALDVLRTSPYPMLVVPGSASLERVPRRLLLAVDGEPFTLGEYAGTMRRLLAGLHAELTVLHIAEPQTAEAATAGALESVRRTGLAVDLPEPLRTRSVAAGRPAEAILKAAQPEECDMVVLVARPRSFLGELFHHSVTAQVLLHSVVPVLVLPAEE